MTLYNVECAACAGYHRPIERLRLMVRKQEPDDVSDLIRQLTDRGWHLPGPICPTCYAARQEAERHALSVTDRSGGA